MTSPEAMLAQAPGFIPDDATVGEATTVLEVLDYLDHDEWEVALGLLEEVGDSDVPVVGVGSSQRHHSGRA